MGTRIKIMIIVYFIAITIGGISATKYYQQRLDYNDEKPWYEAVEINPNDTKTLKEAGSFLYEQGDYKKALEYYNKVLEINPNDTEANLVKSEIEYIMDEIR